MSQKKEKPLPAAAREDRAAQRMAQRIQESAMIAAEYEATLDPRQRPAAA